MFAEVDDMMVILTAIQSPGAVGRLEMEYAADGHHCHQASVICWPLDAIYSAPQNQQLKQSFNNMIDSNHSKPETLCSSRFPGPLTNVVTPACNNALLQDPPSTPTHAAAFCGAFKPARSFRFGTVKTPYTLEICSGEASCCDAPHQLGP